MPPPTPNSEEPLDRLKADHGGALGGAIAMCWDAVENPMMKVPWWVNIGWFHAMRSSISG